MTNKQIKKLVKELVDLELIHQDPNSPKSEKNRVEKRIMAITNQLMMEPNGLVSLMDIDDLVQQKLKEKE